MTNKPSVEWGRAGGTDERGEEEERNIGARGGRQGVRLGEEAGTPGDL